MKIQMNQIDAAQAWMMSVNALDVIKNLYIENVKNEEAKDAWYNLLHHLNEWYNEIEKMPF